MSVKHTDRVGKTPNKSPAADAVCDGGSLARAWIDQPKRTLAYIMSRDVAAYTRRRERGGPAQVSLCAGIKAHAQRLLNVEPLVLFHTSPGELPQHHWHNAYANGPPATVTRFRIGTFAPKVPVRVSKSAVPPLIAPLAAVHPDACPASATQALLASMVSALMQVLRPSPPTPRVELCTRRREPLALPGRADSAHEQCREARQPIRTSQTCDAHETPSQRPGRVLRTAPPTSISHATSWRTGTFHAKRWRTNTGQPRG